MIAFVLGVLFGAGLALGAYVLRRRRFHPMDLKPVVWGTRVDVGERVEFTARTPGRLTWERTI